MTSKTEDSYGSMTTHESVLARPWIYGGTVDQNDRTAIIFGIDNNQFITKTIRTPTLLLHMFIEIVANASDNFIETKLKGIVPKYIEIEIRSTCVKVRSHGEPIPIVIKHPQNMLIPDMIFGTLFSSSNYNDSVVKSGVGQNGIGAKLTNIFSSKFTVRCGDPGFLNRKNDKEYECDWSDNMFKTSGARVRSGYKGESYVEIEYQPDFRRFGKTGFDQDDIGIMVKTAIELSFTLKSPVMINKQIGDYTTVELFSPVCFNELFPYVSVFIQDGKLLPDSVQGKVNTGELRPSYSIYIFDVPSDEYAEIYSYVNGFSTPNQGIHVTKITKILKKLIDEKYKVNAKTIEKTLAMIVVCNVGSPQYIGQTKYALQSYVGSRTQDVEDAITKSFPKIMKLEYMKNYIAELQGNAKPVLSKVNGKNDKHVGFKGRDANDAGPTNGKNLDCTLMIVEGDSAERYADERRTQGPGGPAKWGYIIFKGKVINVSKAAQERIDINTELTQLKFALGIKESDSRGNAVVADYTSLAYRKKNLRYGNGVLILTDPDSDGMHIACLLINFFSRIGNFIEAGLLSFLRPPLVRAYSKKNVIVNRFYDMQAFADYLKTKEGRQKYDYYYFKGLGSCEKELYKDDLTHAMVLKLVWDDLTQQSLDLCFGKYQADERKEWIARQRQKSGTIFSHGRQEITCSEMILDGMKDYNIDTFTRALPCFLDGLKESQRKIVYTALEKWNYGEKTTVVRTDVFASTVCAETHYLHGGASITAALEGMAEDFKGSNNLNFFFPKGNFGDYKGAKASAARYTHLYPEKWVKYAYFKDLIDLIPRRTCEDHEVEPEWIPCDLPPYINPIRGIATGFCTFIPPHSVIDACDTVIHYCDHGNIDGLLPILPHAEKFEEPFEMDDGRNIVEEHESDSETEQDPEPEFDGETLLDANQEYRTIANFKKRVRGRRFYSRGKLRFINSRKLGDDTYTDFAVTELPFGYTANAFEDFVKSLLVKNAKTKGKDGKQGRSLEGIIVDYEDKNEPGEKYNFVIKGFSSKKAGCSPYVFFKLQRSYPMTIMTMITKDGIPLFYDKVEKIFLDWAPRMLEVYRLYKVNKIKQIQRQIDLLEEKMRFIYLVLEKKIQPNWTKARCAPILKEVNLSIDIMDKVSWGASTVEEIENLKRAIQKLKEYKKEVEDTPHSQIWKRRVIKLKEVLINMGKTSQWDAMRC